MTNSAAHFPYVLYFLLGLVFLSALQANAQEPVAATTSRALAVAEPPPAAADHATITRSAPEEPFDTFLLRVGGFVGNGASSQGSTLAVGASMDIQAERYYGMDLYVLYGMMLSQKAAVPGKSDQSGGLFNLKLQYPTELLGAEVTPKLGAGIGSYNGGTELFSGQFAVAGIEAQRGDIAVHAEMYQGIGGTVTMTDSAATEWYAKGTRFQQYRLGAYYRFAPRARAGLDVIRSRWAGVERDQFTLPVQFDF